MLLCSNIVPQRKTSVIADAVLKHMKESICKSLGPFGANTINGTDIADILVTKDGYHIINQAFYNDPVANIFCKIFQDISLELVGSTGDGSTSCIDGAYHFNAGLKESIENGELKGVRQKEMIDSIKYVVGIMMDELRVLSVPVSEDLKEIKSLASVSLNNNEVLGDMISDIYKEIGLEGYINVKLGNTSRTYSDMTDGFMFNFGRMDEIFVNNENNESVLKDSAIMIFNSSVNSDEQEGYAIFALNMINKCINEGYDLKYKSLTIIAPSFSSTFVNVFRRILTEYANKGRRLNFNLIQYSTASEFDREMLYDISIMCGARIITESEKDAGKLVLSLDKTLVQEEIDISSEKDVESDDIEPQVVGDPMEIKLSSIGDYLGYAKKIISGKRTTTFYDADERTDAIEIERGRIKTELQEVIENNSDIKRKYELNKRLAIINKKLVTIYVGGYNEATRKSDKELIDDAVSACRSAIEHGYVVGGNLAIAKIIEIMECQIDAGVLKMNNVQQAILKIIGQAFRNVLKDVFGNKYDLGDEAQAAKVETILDTCISNYTMYDLITEEYTSNNIINPVDTDIEILKHVTSIISLVMTSNQFITKNANEIVGELDFGQELE